MRPFDILGFPVQEDERIFGAFRGRLRVTKQQLFLEPMVEEGVTSRASKRSMMIYLYGMHGIPWVLLDLRWISIDVT